MGYECDNTEIDTGNLELESSSIPDEAQQNEDTYSLQNETIVLFIYLYLKFATPAK